MTGWWGRRTATGAGRDAPTAGGGDAGSHGPGGVAGARPHRPGPEETVEAVQATDAEGVNATGPERADAEGVASAGRSTSGTAGRRRVRRRDRTRHAAGPRTVEAAQAADAPAPSDTSSGGTSPGDTSPGGTPPGGGRADAGGGSATPAAGGAVERGAGGGTAPRYAVVVPTVGRPSLSVLLDALADARGPRPARIVLVDDRPPHDPRPLEVRVPPELERLVEVVPGRGAGPAAARNTGWHAAPEPWTVFLDDDVVPGPDWPTWLAADLAAADDRAAGVQGHIVVPLPSDRRPTDWERTTAGLAAARWITADMAYRRSALEASGGFDERFPRAFREDADLALRLLGAGWELSLGTRRTTHPVRPTDRWVSLRAQAGNADDVLMTRRHGRNWWARAGAFRGRLPQHAAVTGAGVAALASLATGRRRAAATCAALWLAGTTEFAVTRVRPGPRTRSEMARMGATSALIPPLAVGHWLAGQARHRRVPRWEPPPASAVRGG